MSAARTIDFGGVDITFHEGVLEPRAWTVMQAEWARDLARSLPEGDFVELGCGAGHIGLASVARNERRLVQLDASEAACELARGNAARAGLADRVSVRCGSFDGALGAEERFALVIADPPYVPTGETYRYPDDPLDAIDGGPEGLDGIRASLSVAAAHLLSDGAVLLQVWGPGQARQSEALAAVAGLTIVDVRVHDEHRAVALLRPIA